MENLGFWGNGVPAGDDAVVTFHSDASIVRGITTNWDHYGIVNFHSDATVDGPVGDASARLNTINVVNDNYTVDFNDDVYLDTLNFLDVDAGDSTVNFNGNTVLSGANSITTEQDIYGIVNFNGNATIDGKIGDPDHSLWYIWFNSGTASVNDAIRASVVCIKGNATLGLSPNFEDNGGFIDGNLYIQETGTLDVGGNSLEVDGRYTQEVNATLKLTINSATADDSGNVVVAGLTNVATNSKVYVTVPTGLTIAVGTTYTIISMEGTDLTGEALTVTSSTRRYAFTATKSGTEWILTSGGGFAAPAGATGNEAAVGNALNSINGATGDMSNVMDQLGGLSDSEYNAALDTMHPNVSSGAAEGSRSLTSQGFTTIGNRLGGARNGGGSGSGVSSGERLDGIGVWMQALGSHIKQDARKGIEGYMGNLFGTTVGADKVLDDHFRAGFAGSFGWARVKPKTAGSPSDDINSYQATIYGSFDSLDLNKARQSGKRSYEAVRSQVENSWYVDGMAAFTQNDYESRREIWVTPTSGRVAKADHAGQQYSTNFETGYKFVFEKTKALEVTPFVSLGYNYLYMNKYKEKGADSLNLTVNGEGFHQLEQGLGTKLAYPIVAKKVGTFIPSAKAAWLYDYIGDRFETTASFAGGGSSFNTQGAKPAKSGMLFGAELAFLNKGNMTMTGNWDIELKDQYMSNTYYGTVRYDF